MNARAFPGLPITEASPVAHDGPLPERADVVVVGGGVIGVCTALYLARKGVSVLLLEKGRIAGEQSARNWGWIRQTGRDIDELPIAMEANRLWQDLAAEIGEDLGVRRIGLTYLAETEAQLAEYEDWLTRASVHRVDSALLRADAVADLIPGMTRRFAGALHTPSDMKGEPWVSVPLIARLAASEGAVIREACAVRMLDVAAGRVAGVMTEKGRVACDAVVVAGGAWSSLLLRRHGVDIPQLSVLATVCATGPLPQVTAGGAAAHDVAFRPRADGGYSVAPSDFHEMFMGPDALRHARKYLPVLRQSPFGRRYRTAAPKGYPDAWSTPRHWTAEDETPFERMRILDPDPSPGRAEEAVRAFAALFPELGEVPIKAAWAGMIDAMPDVVPVVDHAPDLPGLSICTGMSGHGFGIGPGFGRIMADLVTGDAPGHDLRRFRFSRFTDGSPIVPGPGF